MTDRSRWAWRLLVLEAAVWLALARLCLRCVPFRRLQPWLGTARPAVPADDGAAVAEAERRVAQRIGAAVRRAVQAVPFEALCLPQAMAAKAMLARRGVRATLHLGAMPAAGSPGIAAHAWVMLGATVVVGGSGRPGHVELARFG